MFWLAARSAGGWFSLLNGNEKSSAVVTASPSSSPCCQLCECWSQPSFSGSAGVRTLKTYSEGVVSTADVRADSGPIRSSRRWIDDCEVRDGNGRLKLRRWFGRWCHLPLEAEYALVADSADTGCGEVASDEIDCCSGMVRRGRDGAADDRRDVVLPGAGLANCMLVARSAIDSRNNSWMDARSSGVSPG